MKIPEVPKIIGVAGVGTLSYIKRGTTGVLNNVVPALLPLFI
jgi:hypothetical protein